MPSAFFKIFDSLHGHIKKHSGNRPRIESHFQLWTLETIHAAQSGFRTANPLVVFALSLCPIMADQFFFKHCRNVSRKTAEIDILRVMTGKFVELAGWIEMRIRSYMPGDGFADIQHSAVLGPDAVNNLPYFRLNVFRWHARTISWLAYPVKRQSEIISGCFCLGCSGESALSGNLTFAPFAQLGVPGFSAGLSTASPGCLQFFKSDCRFHRAQSLLRTQASQCQKYQLDMLSVCCNLPAR